MNCWLFRDLRTPFGGVKNSGVGREGGWDALNFSRKSKISVSGYSSVMKCIKMYSKHLMNY